MARRVELCLPTIGPQSIPCLSSSFIKPCKERNKMAANKIMIVDDDKEFLEKLQEILTLSGYNSIAINESTIALQAVHTIKPDVILLDIKMKGIYRFHLAERLEENVALISDQIGRAHV